MKTVVNTVSFIAAIAALTLSGYLLTHRNLKLNTGGTHESRERENVTTESATGSATGKFDCVEFSLSVEGRGETGPESKTKTQLVITNTLQPALDKLSDKLKQAGSVVFDEVKSNFTTEQQFAYRDGKAYAEGYRTVYWMSFSTKLVDKVTEIQDVLTSLTGVSIGSPVFSVTQETRQKLQNKAVEDAFKIAQARFKNECSILSLEPSNFEIGSWNVNYDSYYRPFYARSMDRAGAPQAESVEPIKVESGLASVHATLNVSYKKVNGE